MMISSKWRGILSQIKQKYEPSIIKDVIRVPFHKEIIGNKFICNFHTIFHRAAINLTLWLKAITALKICGDSSQIIITQFHRNRTHPNKRSFGARADYLRLCWFLRRFFYSFSSPRSVSCAPQHKTSVCPVAPVSWGTCLSWTAMGGLLSVERSHDGGHSKHGAFNL